MGLLDTDSWDVFISVAIGILTMEPFTELHLISQNKLCLVTF
jgi:hypothetical protein